MQEGEAKILFDEAPIPRMGEPHELDGALLPFHRQPEHS